MKCIGCNVNESESDNCLCTDCHIEKLAMYNSIEVKEFFKQKFARFLRWSWGEV